MNMCAPYSQYRCWRSLVKAAVSVGEPIPPNEQQQIVKSNLNGFMGWLLFHIGSVGTSGRRQMFYHTFVMQYYGLSRDGVDTLAKLGYCQSIRTYDDSKLEATHIAKDKTRYFFVKKQFFFS